MIKLKKVNFEDLDQYQDSVVLLTHPELEVVAVPYTFGAPDEHDDWEGWFCSDGIGIEILDEDTEGELYVVEK